MGGLVEDAPRRRAGFDPGRLQPSITIVAGGRGLLRQQKPVGLLDVGSRADRAGIAHHQFHATRKRVAGRAEGPGNRCRLTNSATAPADGCRECRREAASWFPRDFAVKKWSMSARGKRRSSPCGAVSSLHLRRNLRAAQFTVIRLWPLFALIYRTFFGCGGKPL